MKNIMSVPILKMNQSDVQTAIARQFRKSLTDLPFSKGQKFSNLDSTANCVFFLQNPFCGVGIYNFRGQAGMFDESGTFSTTYNLEGNVEVSENNGSPSIQFNGVITCNKL